MAGLSTTVNRLASTISGLSNAFAGQTRTRARLNAIMSYDQSNELFKVARHLLDVINLLLTERIILGIFEQGNDVFLRSLGRRRGGTRW